MNRSRIVCSFMTMPLGKEGACRNPRHAPSGIGRVNSNRDAVRATRPPPHAPCPLLYLPGRCSCRGRCGRLGRHPVHPPPDPMPQPPEVPLRARPARPLPKPRCRNPCSGKLLPDRQMIARSVSRNRRSVPFLDPTRLHDFAVRRGKWLHSNDSARTSRRCRRRIQATPRPPACVGERLVDPFFERS